MSYGEDLQISPRVDAAIVSVATLVASGYTYLGLLVAGYVHYNLAYWPQVWIAGGMMMILRFALGCPIGVGALSRSTPAERSRFRTLILGGTLPGAFFAVLFPFVWMFFHTVTARAVKQMYSPAESAALPPIPHTKVIVITNKD